MPTLKDPIIPVRRAMRPGIHAGRTGFEWRSQAAGRLRGNEIDAPRARRRPVILLAEDDGAMRSLLASQLLCDGYRVIACQDATELVHRIDLYRSHHVPVGIDLVISDVRMPLISGLELLELVNDTPLEIPVILISAFGDIETRVKAGERAAAAFFSKPFDIADLRDAVRTNLNRAA